MSGASLNQLELDAAILQGRLDGFAVERADDYSLLLDIDTPHAMAQYERVLPLVSEHFGAVEKERWASKSGNTHIRVHLPCALPWHMRYALESALGSDGVRSVLALRQMLNGCDEASMLFRPQPVTEAVTF